jgi:hypothetical protein
MALLGAERDGRPVLIDERESGGGLLGEDIVNCGRTRTLGGLRRSNRQC